MSPFKLYTANTPNGHKVSITLEKLGLDYEVIEIDVYGEGAPQRGKAYTELNPHQKIPLLIDEGKGVKITQSGAIVQYLTANYDPENKLGYAPHSNENTLETELLFLESTELAIMLNQVFRYKIYLPVSIPEPLERFTAEAKRTLATLEKYLERNQKNGLLFVGDRYCSSDSGIGAWLCLAPTLELDLKQYPLLSAWHSNFLADPEVKKGLAVPHRV